MPKKSWSSRPANPAPKWFTDEMLTHETFLKKFAFKLVPGSRALREDLVQETFLRAMESWKSYQPGTNMKHWLGMILRNLTYSHFRKGKTHKTYTTWLEGDIEREMGPPNVATIGLEAEEVRQAMLTLNPENARALTLVVQGFSYDEVAEIEQVAVGTVKSRTSRARATLVATFGGPS